MMHKGSKELVVSNSWRNGKIPKSTWKRIFPAQLLRNIPTNTNKMGDKNIYRENLLVEKR